MHGPLSHEESHVTQPSLVARLFSLPRPLLLVGLLVLLIASSVPILTLAASHNVNTKKTTTKATGVSTAKKPAPTAMATTANITTTANTTKASASSGVTYYVATTGKDSDPGTLDKPFATITHTVSIVKPGDTVNVRGGTYNLSNGIGLSDNGTQAAPITFQSAPGEHAILNASNVPANTTCLVMLGQYIVVKNLECSGPWFQGMMAWNSQHSQFIGDTIHGINQYGMLIASDKMGGTSDITVSNTTIYNDGSVSGGTGGLDVTYADGVTITNNLIYQNNGLGLDFNGAKNIVAKSNTLHDNSGDEIQMNNVTDSTIDSNFLYESVQASAHANGSLPRGIAMANYSDISPNPLNNNKVINNIVFGSDTAFMYVEVGRGGGIKNTLVANNTFYEGSKGYTAYIEGTDHQNTQFTNNIFVQTQSNQSAGSISNNSGISFSHNTWWGGSATGGASASDVNVNPKFVHEGTTTASDYQLQAGSPDRDHGVVVSAADHDFSGKARPQSGPYSIGAYQ